MNPHTPRQDLPSKTGLEQIQGQQRRSALFVVASGWLQGCCWLKYEGIGQSGLAL
jgi:hypothetical protein